MSGICIYICLHTSTKYIRKRDLSSLQKSPISCVYIDMEGCCAGPTCQVLVYILIYICKRGLLSLQKSPISQIHIDIEGCCECPTCQVIVYILIYIRNIHP